MRDIGVLAAFGAGLLSFLSPCVLPLIPGYLSFISGYGLADIRGGGGRGRVFSRTLAFVLGFSLVFVALGMLFSSGGIALGIGGGIGGQGGLGRNGPSLSQILSILAGILVILLGLNLIFDLVKFLDLEARFHPGKAPKGFGGAFVLGLAFAAGWSPCIGPILASILLLAAREGSFAVSVLLLGAYGLGLALPFLAAGLFFDRMKPIMDFFKRRAREVRIVSGLLLVLLGTAMAFGRIALVSQAAARLGFFLKESLVSHPGALRLGFGAAWLAVAAALIAPPLLRKKLPLKPARIAFAALLALIGIAELAGLLSTAGILAEWLLFQGA